MEAELLHLLTGDAALGALVQRRIFWNAYPQEEQGNPCVRMTKITGAAGYHMQGSDRLTFTTVQIDVRAVTVTSMWAVRDALIGKLDGFAGQRDGVLFRGIFLQSERQASERPGTVQYHTASLDFEVVSGSAS